MTQNLFSTHFYMFPLMDLKGLLEHLTFTLVLIPGVDTVLHAVAHQCVVYAHVAVTEEGISITWSWRGTKHINATLSR